MNVFCVVQLCTKLHMFINLLTIAPAPPPTINTGFAPLPIPEFTTGGGGGEAFFVKIYNYSLFYYYPFSSLSSSPKNHLTEEIT